MAAANLRSLQEREKQRTLGLRLLGMSMAEAASLLRASNWGVCPSTFLLSRRLNASQPACGCLTHTLGDLGCAGVQNRAELLLSELQEPNVSVTPSGRMQFDLCRRKYPASVTAWQDFPKNVLEHRAGLPITQRWFPEAFQDAARVSQGALPLPQ